MYDIIFIGNKAHPNFRQLKERFPTAKQAETFAQARKKSLTKMFWTVYDDVLVLDNWDFSYEATEYDNEYIHVFLNKDDYDGVALHPKKHEPAEREIEYRYYVNKKEVEVVASQPDRYDIFEIDNWEQYQHALQNTTTEMFWMTSANIDTSDFNFGIYFSHRNSYDRNQNHAFVHQVGKEKFYNGVFLCSKNVPFTKREVEYRFPVNKKEWNVVASKPKTYDVFEIDTHEDYCTALEQTTTEMFWMTSANLDTSEFDFDIYFTHDNEYDRKQNHAFIHQVNGEDYYNGVFLCSKHIPLSAKEVNYRFPVNRKEWNIVASTPAKYDIFEIDSWEQYQHALENTHTEMFWMSSANIDTSDFNFDIYFTHDNEYDRRQNHVFIHQVKNENYRNGLFLCSKQIPLTKREVEHRFPVNSKEWNIVASKPTKYDVFEIETYDDYQQALENTHTEMFWMSSANIDTSDFNFDIYFTHDNEYDRKQNHAFIHQVKNENYRNGLFLCSKHVPLSAKEVNYRFPVNSKEWNIVASKPTKYDVFEIETYDDYQQALENARTEMFWMSSANIDTSDFNFDIYFTHDNEYDRKQNHAFIHQVNGENYRNGVFLCSKHVPLSKKEVEHRFPVNRKEWDIVASKPVEYDRFTVNTYDEYKQALTNASTELFWIYPSNIEVVHGLDTYFTHDNEYDRKINHTFLHNDGGEYLRNGVWLCSKHLPLGKKELEYRFVLNAKEHEEVASRRKYYDKFYISTYEDYERAREITTTDMFWVIFNDVQELDKFDWNLYFPYNHMHDKTNMFDRNINHTFLHDDEGETTRGGVWLCSKAVGLGRKEVEYRYVVNAKEHNQVASKRKYYERFYIENFEDYQRARASSTTDMFWVIFNDVQELDKFNWKLYFPRKHMHDTENEFELNINHTFVHDDNGEHTCGGVWLCSKAVGLGKKEVDYRYVVNAKEHNEVASVRKYYDKFEISTYEDYEHALASATTEMFWIVFKDVKPKKNFNWNLYYSYKHMHDATNEFDRKINHTWIHQDGDEQLRNGVWLCSKHVSIGKRELEYRFLVNAKEHDEVASTRKLYQKFAISNYQDYLKALEKSQLDMFWATPKDVSVTDKEIFKTYYPYKHLHDVEHKFDREINHVYKNGEFQDGVILCSKHAKISQREWDYGFIVNKKEVPISASKPKPFDIVFISYNEIDADRRYIKLCKRFPNAKWVHGVKGIHQAHIAAAKLCDTGMFWVVDGDAEITDDFDFDFQVPRWEHDMVHVWRSQNPITGLEYGYGGVKLLPKQLTLEVDVTSTDMTTSISSKFKAVPKVSNITKFNTDAFSTWRSAFRECVKLTLNDDTESQERLEAWLHPVPNADFRHDAKNGAEQGNVYALEHTKDTQALALINDFDWLKDRYESR
jgi:hypothetical protein